MVKVESDRFASRKLADLLRSEILEGVKYPPGARLPAVRQLRDDHGVALNTAQAAIRRLVTEGLAEIRGTTGAYVRDRESDDIPEGPEIRAELARINEQLRRTQQNLDETKRAVSELMQRIPNE